MLKTDIQGNQIIVELPAEILGGTHLLTVLTDRGAGTSHVTLGPPVVPVSSEKSANQPSAALNEKDRPSAPSSSEAATNPILAPELRLNAGEPTSSNMDEVYSNGSQVLVDSGSISLTGTLPNNVLEIVAGADHGNSPVDGGALNIDNTNNVGSALVIYDNTGSNADGRTLAIHQDHPSNQQHTVFIRNDGLNSALMVDCHTQSGIGACVNVTSVDRNQSTFGIRGEETGNGTLKIIHKKPAAPDADAAAISLLMQGSGTAAQMIFGNTESGITTTGDLIDLRQNGVPTFVVNNKGSVTLSGIFRNDFPIKEPPAALSLFSNSGTAQVTFPEVEVSNAYFVTLGCNASETFWWSLKKTNGFRINSSNPNSTAVCDWIMIR